MFADSYLGKLRAIVGPRLLLVPSVRAIITDSEGRVLLQKRLDYGNWGLPGGSPEPGEFASQAMEREVLEETGLIVLEARPFGFASDPASEMATYPNGHQIHAYSLLFEVLRYSGDLGACMEEGEGLAFFPPDALPEMNADQRRTVEHWSEFRRTGAFQLY